MIHFFIKGNQNQLITILKNIFELELNQIHQTDFS